MPQERHVKLSSRAQRDYKKLSSDLQDRIKRSLKDLAYDPSSVDIKKLKGVDGREDLYRSRVGDYRIIYFPTETEILVIRIDHRKRIYGFLD